MQTHHNQTRGLYDSRFEHDACGVGLLVNVKGIKSHRLVEQGLQVLEHMVHRGAEGADPKTGDGAGIMVQVPHEFILLQGIPVPEKGRYGTGLVFMPKDEESQAMILDVIEREALQLGLKLMAVRDVPTNNEQLGSVARSAEPAIRQIFVSDEETNDPIEIRLYLLRKAVEKKNSGLGRYCRQRRVLHSVALIAYHSLQGYAFESPAQILLSRPHESAFHDGNGTRAFALLDQHFSDVVAGPAVPYART